jgi:hypothetical protein
MDIDMYDGIPPSTPLTGPWIIPRKLPSVVMVNGREVASLRNAAPPLPRMCNRESNKDEEGKPRLRGGLRRSPGEIRTIRFDRMAARLFQDIIIYWILGRWFP